MNRFTRGIASAAARHPWRTIATWVVVLGAVFALAGSGGGGFIDDFSAKGSQSERALRLLEDKFPEATQATALVVFAVDDGETLQSQQQDVDAVLGDVAGADHVVAVADPFASGTISEDGRIGYAVDHPRRDARRAGQGVLRAPHGAGRRVEHRRPPGGARW